MNLLEWSFKLARIGSNWPHEIQFMISDISGVWHELREHARDADNPIPIRGRRLYILLATWSGHGRSFFFSLPRSIRSPRWVGHLGHSWSAHGSPIWTPRQVWRAGLFYACHQLCGICLPPLQSNHEAHEAK